MAKEVFICNVDDLATRLGFKVINGDETVGIFKLSNGEIYAIGNECPGFGFPLTDGIVCEDTVYCALHDEQVDLKTGKELTDETGTHQVKTYPVSIKDNKVYLTI